MARTKPPAFQFYAKDWLADTREFPPLARAMLIDLMASCWENGSVPTDLGGLAAIAGMSLKEARVAWPAIEHKFIATDNGRLTNRRLEVERKQQEEYREKQANNGRASGEARRSNRSTTVEPRLNDGSTTVEPTYQPKPNSASASASAVQDPSPPHAIHGTSGTGYGLAYFDRDFRDTVKREPGDAASMRAALALVLAWAGNEQPHEFAVKLMRSYRAMLDDWTARGFHPLSGASHFVTHFARVQDFAEGKRPGPKDAPTPRPSTPAPRVAASVEETDRMIRERKAVQVAPPPAEFLALRGK